MEQKSYMINTVIGVSHLMAVGLTQQEIADELKIHRVTVARYKKFLREQYFEDKAKLL